MDIILLEFIFPFEPVEKHVFSAINTGVFFADTFDFSHSDVLEVIIVTESLAILVGVGEHDTAIFDARLAVELELVTWFQVPPSFEFNVLAIDLDQFGLRVL
jgi:hypothetical protein